MRSGINPRSRTEGGSIRARGASGLPNAMRERRFMAQVFDAGSGRKLFEIRTKFCNAHSGYAQYHNFWLDDRHLIFDMDNESRI